MSNDTHDRHGNQGHDDDKGPKPEPVTIQVNSVNVTMPDKHATGVEIKRAALQAGLPIALEWVLSDERERIIPDDKKLSLKDGDDFWVVPGDDNS